MAGGRVIFWVADRKFGEGVEKRLERNGMAQADTALQGTLCYMDTWPLLEESMPLSKVARKSRDDCRI